MVDWLCFAPSFRLRSAKHIRYGGTSIFLHAERQRKRERTNHEPVAAMSERRSQCSQESRASAAAGGEAVIWERRGEEVKVRTGSCVRLGSVKAVVCALGGGDCVCEDGGRYFYWACAEATVLCVGRMVRCNGRGRRGRVYK